MKHIPHFLISLLFFIPFWGAIAQNEPNADLKPYNLFNPVPKNEMREFSIDRPDITESPITVDAGHFQFEGELYKWTRFNWGTSLRVVNYFNGLYKIGISKSWDIHLGIELYNQYQDAEGKTVEKGFGNTTIRLKHNFWGNESETRSAFGMIPYITLPTSPLDHDAFFGIGFPFSYTLTEKLGTGAQFQFDFIPDGNGNYNLGYLQTVVLGGALIGDIDFFFEGMGIFYQGSSIFTLNSGFVYSATNNMKIDLGSNLGLTDDSLTRIFFGLSFRI